MDELPRIDAHVIDELLETFRAVRHLHDHWAQPGPSMGYYWFATFEEATEVHRLVQRCQDQLRFPYYDHVPPAGLHLTLDRIAFDHGATSDQLDAIARAARHQCQDMQPFIIQVAVLTGTPGAVGLNVFPPEPVHELRRALRAATLSVLPDAPVKDPAPAPHVSIAYANTDGVPAAASIAASENLAVLPAATTRVRNAVMVRLEQGTRCYRWKVIATVALGSSGGTTGRVS